MTIQLGDYLFDSGAALVLHGESELLDADFAQLRTFSRKQRAAITSVVLSETSVTGACLQHMALLPHLKALYANKTRIGDDAPLEQLPRTLKIINLDQTEVGDVCVSKLKKAHNLRSVRLRKTGVTGRGIRILARMSFLRECHVDSMAVH